MTLPATITRVILVLNTRRNKTVNVCGGEETVPDLPRWERTRHPNHPGLILDEVMAEPLSIRPSRGEGEGRFGPCCAVKTPSDKRKIVGRSLFFAVGLPSLLIRCWTDNTRSTRYGLSVGGGVCFCFCCCWSAFPASGSASGAFSVEKRKKEKEKKHFFVVAFVLFSTHTRGSK